LFDQRAGRAAARFGTLIGLLGERGGGFAIARQPIIAEGHCVGPADSRQNLGKAAALIGTGFDHGSGCSELAHAAWIASISNSL